MPLARPAPDAPVATLWVLLKELFHGEPATRAGNPGVARGSKPVAEVYTAARAVEWLIHLALGEALERLLKSGHMSREEVAGMLQTLQAREKLSQK